MKRGSALVVIILVGVFLMSVVSAHSWFFDYGSRPYDLSAKADYNSATGKYEISATLNMDNFDNISGTAWCAGTIEQCCPEGYDPVTMQCRTGMNYLTSDATIGWGCCSYTDGCTKLDCSTPGDFYHGCPNGNYVKSTVDLNVFTETKTFSTSDLTDFIIVAQYKTPTSKHADSDPNPGCSAPIGVKPTLVQYCGDKTCSESLGETCSTCTADCGPCIPPCAGDQTIMNISAPTGALAYLWNYDSSQNVGAEPSSSDSSLSGYWKFDGSLTDSSSKGNDAIAYGYSPNPSASAYGPGKFGQAFKLNADGVVITSKNTINLAGKSFSLGAWFKRDYPNDKGISRQIIGHGSPAGGAGQGTFIGINPDNRVYCGIYGADLVSSKYVTDSDWHSVYCTFNNSNYNLSLYFDGSYVSSLNVGGAYAGPSSRIFIGAVPWESDYYFNGSVDNAFVFEKVLSASEVAGFYSAGAQNYPICYSSLFGETFNGPNPHSCNEINNILWLNQTGNSLVSTTNTTAHNVPVCYGNLWCANDSSSGNECSNGGVVIARLNQTDNAYIANASETSYPVKICCKKDQVFVANWTDMNGNIINKTPAGVYVNMKVTPGIPKSYQINQKMSADSFKALPLQTESRWNASAEGFYTFRALETTSNELNVSGTRGTSIPHVTFINPNCGSNFSINDSIQIVVNASDPYDLLSGVLDFGDGTNAPIVNGINTFVHNYSVGGTKKIVASVNDLAEGYQLKKVNNIIIIDNRTSAKYLAGCIDTPKDAERLDSASVTFNATSTRAIYFNAVTQQIEPISLDLVNFTWTLSDIAGSNTTITFKNNACFRIHKTMGVTDCSNSGVKGYYFNADFPTPGGNWAKMDVQLD